MASGVVVQITNTIAKAKGIASRVGDSRLVIKALSFMTLFSS